MGCMKQALVMSWRGTGQGAVSVASSENNSGPYCGGGDFSFKAPTVQTTRAKCLPSAQPGFGSSSRAVREAEQTGARLYKRATLTIYMAG